MIELKVFEINGEEKIICCYRKIKNLMNIKILNFALSIGILICNIPLLIANFEIVRSHGGPMGVGLIASPILLICNLFTIPALLSFFKRNYQNKTILILNILGIICCGFLAFLLITTPQMD